MKKIILLFFLLAGATISAQPCFNMVMYSAPFSTNQIISGDFNKDGKADLAAVGTTPSLIVWLGNGSGAYNSFSTYSIGGGNSYYLCSGDFNNDGNLDIATANNPSNSVSVLLGTGSGTFGSASTFAVGSSPMSVCTGDFNNDGNLDLAATTSSGVSVLLGTGSGSYGTAANYSVGGSPYDITAADFTGDGNVDLVCTAFNASNVTMLTGSSNGTFTVGSNYTTNGSSPAGIAKLDFNSDGLMDVVVCNEASNNYCILVNNGTGGFNSMPGLGIGSQQQPRNIAVAEFNNSSPLDVVMADFSNLSPYYVSVGYNAGSAFGLSTGSGTQPHGVCTGDFNNDGKPDFAIANQGSSNICIFLNNNPYITVSGNQVICSGQSTTLTASGANTYTWSSNAGSANTTTVSVNPTANTTYTVSGNTPGCSSTGQTVVTVSVNPVPSSLTIFYNGPTTICQGDSTSMTATVDPGTSTVWMPGNYTGTVVTVTPTVTTNYSVTSTYTATGCSYGSNFPVITVKTSPTLSVAATSTVVCSGSPVTLTASGASTYTWTGGISNGVVFNPTVTATYSVVGTATNSCTGKASKTITVNQLPTVVANSSPSGPVCMGTPITLYGSGTATTYTWSGGITNGVAFPATSGIYTVTGTDGNNCSNTNTISVSAPAANAPAICMVTVDSLSINNIIIWDKTTFQNADTFFIYRDTANNNFCRVGKVPYSALSQFIDTARSISAVNGDPNITTYRYKLAYVDTCGNMSPLSPFHNTIYHYNSGSLFLWNAYQIEGQTIPVPGLSQYQLRRDNLGGTGNYVTAATAGASSTQINDPQYATYQMTADWRVETVWSIACTPTARQASGVQGTVVKSKSNISNNRTTHINKILDQLISIYPNPTNGKMQVRFNLNVRGKVILKVYSSLGNEVYSVSLTNPTEDVPVDLSAFDGGIYTVQLVTDAGSISKRIIKN